MSNQKNEILIKRGDIKQHHDTIKNLWLEGKTIIEIRDTLKCGLDTLKYFMYDHGLTIQKRNNMYNNTIDSMLRKGHSYEVITKATGASYRHIRMRGKKFYQKLGSSGYADTMRLRERIKNGMLHNKGESNEKTN